MITLANNRLGLGKTEIDHKRNAISQEKFQGTDVNKDKGYSKAVHIQVVRVCEGCGK